MEWRRHSEIGLLAVVLACLASLWRLTPSADVSVALPDSAQILPSRLTRIEETGKRIYVSICAYCHGENGDGFGLNASNLAVPPRNHTDAAYMNSRTDEQLVAVIKYGGASQGKSALMPPWGGRLNEREISALVAYVRALSRGQRSEDNKNQE